MIEASIKRGERSDETTMWWPAHPRFPSRSTASLFSSSLDRSLDHLFIVYRYSLERRDPGDSLANYQRVDVVRSFVRVHALEVGHVAHRRVLGEDSVAAEHP